MSHDQITYWAFIDLQIRATNGRKERSAGKVYVS